MRIAAQYKGKRRIAGLQELVALSKDIGFTILDEDSLRKFSKYLVVNDSNQTPLFHLCIWAYQLERLETCIDDFLSISDGVISVLIPLWIIIIKQMKIENLLTKLNLTNIMYQSCFKNGLTFDPDTAKMPNFSKIS